MKIRRRTKRSPTIAINPEDIKAVIQDVERRHKITELENEVERAIHDLFRIKFEKEEAWKCKMLCDHYTDLIKNASLNKEDEIAENLNTDLTEETKTSEKENETAEDTNTLQRANDTAEDTNTITKPHISKIDSKTLLSKCVENKIREKYIEFEPTESRDLCLKEAISPLINRVYIPVRSNDFISCLKFFEKHIDQSTRKN